MKSSNKMSKIWGTPPHCITAVCFANVKVVEASAALWGQQTTAMTIHHNVTVLIVLKFCSNLAKMTRRINGQSERSEESRQHPPLRSFAPLHPPFFVLSNYICGVYRRSSRSCRRFFYISCFKMRLTFTPILDFNPSMGTLKLHINNHYTATR